MSVQHNYIYTAQETYY